MVAHEILQCLSLCYVSVSSFDDKAVICFFFNCEIGNERSERKGLLVKVLGVEII